MDVVRGMHVGSEAGIVVGLEAHGRRVMVRLVVGFPSWTADCLLFFVFEGLGQHGLKGLHDIGAALLPIRLGDGRGERGAPYHLLFPPVGEQPVLLEDAPGAFRQLPMERSRLPDEPVLVGVGLEFRAVDEGHIKTKPELTADLLAKAGEYLLLVGYNHLVDKPADGRVVHPGLLHDGDVSQVEPAGRLDIPERIPVERKTIEYHGEETVVVAVRPSSRCRIVPDLLLDDCADPRILEKGEKSVDSGLFLLL